jgi:hypothetical protein
MPSTTVIMPAYKAAAIRQTKARVYAQFFPDWGLWVVDEESTAHTGRFTATAEVAELALGG